MFLDYLGNPIAVDDLIVYPTQRGSGSAQMVMARVTAVDPLVPDPSGHGYCYESMKNKANHAKRGYPTHMDASGRMVKDHHRAYGLKVVKLWEGTRRFGKLSYENEGRAFTVRNVQHVVVVTDINGRNVTPLG